MFKQLRHLGKTTLALIILTTPLASRAAVDMNISISIDDQDPAVSSVFHYLQTGKNGGEQATSATKLTVNMPTKIIVDKVMLSEIRSRLIPETSNFCSSGKTLNDTSSINNKITTAL